jgi:hypothetical protein
MPFFFLLLLELDCSDEADWSLELEPAAVPLSLEEPDFWPERVAAGVLLAFSCASPDELMWDCALSSPVDFDDEVPLLSLELVPEEDALGLEDDALLPFIELLSLEEPVDPDVVPLLLVALSLLYVDDVVLAFVLGAFLFLCMSPSARAEPLASRTTEERKTGASLRMGASWDGW